eukprot:3911268-Rhodomonas_salina.1
MEVWNVSDPREHRALPTISGSATASVVNSLFAWSPDGTRIAAITGEGCVVQDMTAGSDHVEATLATGPSPQHMVSLLRCVSERWATLRLTEGAREAGVGVGQPAPGLLRRRQLGA